MPKAALFIVATPIGNLDDMTPRALRTLREVDLIAAEDTRRAGLLLQHFAIGKKELISYHDHVEAAKAEPLVARLVRDDLTMALISDAGTPCISDPGYRLVQAARRAGIAVHPIPGASAVTALVSASGLPSDRFLFVGFLPTKEAAVRRELKTWGELGAAVVFYEAPRRLRKTLAAIRDVYPKAQVAIGRELTKLHEEIVTMPIDAAMDWASGHESLKGEAAIMVHPGVILDENEAGMQASDEGAIKATAVKAFANGATLKDLLKRFADCGFSRSDLYRILLEAKAQVQDED